MEMVRLEGHVRDPKHEDTLLICVNRITSTTPLKTGITKEDTLSCFGGELVLLRI